MKKQYVSYLRVSTKDQERSGTSWEVQRGIIRHYTSKDEAEIVKEYIEVKSGKSIENRPQIKEAIKYCKQNECYLVVSQLDRLSRDVQDIFGIKKQLGDKLIICDLPNTDSLTLSIYAGIAQRERELISLRIKLALQQKKKEGVVLGNPKNLTPEAREKAYKRTREKARKNHNNIIARELVNEYRQKGMTYQSIADKLNEMGIKTSRGMRFQKMTIKRFL